MIANTADELIPDNLLAFNKYCDCDGIPHDISDCNSKSGNSYNHKITWQQLPNKITNGKAFDYYPRGRVEIKRNKAIIWINEMLSDKNIINEIIREFGLSQLEDIEIKIDGSMHYMCHFDKGYYNI